MWEQLQQATVTTQHLPCRFNCLVHVTVIPCTDVATVQQEMHANLSNAYNHPSGVLQLLADPDSIHTTAVGKKQLRPADVCLKLILLHNNLFSVSRAFRSRHHQSCKSRCCGDESLSSRNYHVWNHIIRYHHPLHLLHQSLHHHPLHLLHQSLHHHPLHLHHQSLHHHPLHLHHQSLHHYPLHLHHQSLLHQSLHHHPLHLHHQSLLHHPLQLLHQCSHNYHLHNESCKHLWSVDHMWIMIVTYGKWLVVNVDLVCSSVFWGQSEFFLKRRLWRRTDSLHLGMSDRSVQLFKFQEYKTKVPSLIWNVASDSLQLNSSLPDEMMKVIDLQLLPTAHRYCMWASGHIHNSPSETIWISDWSHLQTSSRPAVRSLHRWRSK